MEERVENQKESEAFVDRQAKKILVVLVATLVFYLCTVSLEVRLADTVLLINIVALGIACFLIAMYCADEHTNSVAFFSRVSAFLAVAALVINHFAFHSPLLTLAGAIGLLFSFLPRYFAKAVKVE